MTVKRYPDYILTLYSVPFRRACISSHVIIISIYLYLAGYIYSSLERIWTWGSVRMWWAFQWFVSTGDVAFFTSISVTECVQMLKKRGFLNVIRHFPSNNIFWCFKFLHITSYTCIILKISIGIRNTITLKNICMCTYQQAGTICFNIV